MPDSLPVSPWRARSPHSWPTSGTPTLKSPSRTPLESPGIERGRLLRSAYTLARATSIVIEAGTNLPRVGGRGSPSAGGNVTTTLACLLPHLGGSCGRRTSMVAPGVVGAQGRRATAGWAPQGPPLDGSRGVGEPVTGRPSGSPVIGRLSTSARERQPVHSPRYRPTPKGSRGSSCFTLALPILRAYPR